MSVTRSRDSSLPACERYTAILANSRKSRLPPGFSQPQPPSAWPQENVALLERYLDWLAEDGAGQTCIHAYYLPVAGHALGFNLKPHAQLDLQADLERVMAYAQARQLARHSLVMTRHARNRFRRFLRLERDIVESAVSLEPVDVTRYEEGLPAWLEDLCLRDLNVSYGQLVVRRGKGLQDRAVYLAGGVIAALTAYLAVRGSGETEHVFLFRYRPLCKDFIRGRIKAAGERVGVKVTPHQLRHTFATQLLNAGCRITIIQALLGHRHLNTTMTYARVHDHKVADDYFAAMAVIEEQLEAHLETLRSGNSLPGQEPNCLVYGEDNSHLLELVDALDAGALNDSQRDLLRALHNSLLALEG